ncbi:MAG: tetratricopeptide repeat protein, partial [Thermoanaerobaculia bacterium]|nr:tetratricopeptide repeat protein [Thermoanaerobaculia bacterium]
VIAVIAIGAAVLAGYFRSQEMEAQKVLAEGIAVMQAQAGEEVRATSTTYETDEARIEAAETIFRKVVDEYGSRDAADVALLYLAQIEASRGEFESAREKFEGFIDDYPDHILAGSAELSLINLRLAAGEIDQVIADLQGRIDGEEERLPRPALLAILAQAYDMKGENDKANEAYRRIANEYPDSPYSLDAQRRLAQS